MKKKNIFILSLLLSAFAATAQEGKPAVFQDWDPNPKMHAVPPEYMNEHALILLESQKHDFKFEGTGITQYTTYHRIIKVLDRRGVEQYNQIDVPFKRNFSRVDSIKARTILPDGTVRNLSYKMLYLGSGELFFALDGVEKNAEIEIVVKYKALSSYFGSIPFQSTVPVMYTEFELNYPKEMTFNVKGYHGFPSGTEQIVGGHKQIKIKVRDIPALNKQPFSFYDLYLMRLEYGLDHFTTRGGYINGDAYNWNRLANNIYTEFYSFKKADMAAVGKFLTSVGIRGGESNLEKIKMIEDGIKNNIVQFAELSGKDAENIDTIISKKAASEKGIIKLFCACLRATGINHELGKTSDRTEHLLDTKFINWAPLENYVFYFPAYNKYLAPNEVYFRYPEIPSDMLNNKGVFCKTNPETEVNIGRETTEAEGIIRTISATDIVPTENNLNANINLSADLEPSVNLSYTYTGYTAEEYRTTLAIAAKEKRKEIVEGMVGLLDKPENLLDYSFSNENFNAVYKHKPLVLKATVRAPQMIEKAGGKYLIRIGEAIGHQPDLYSKEERILPIDIDYPNTNTRTITMNIPDGCKILNANVLKNHVEHNDKTSGNATAYFKSDYTLTGNKLTVTITEAYSVLHYPVSEFNDFKRVVNASADFDKVSLVLEVAKPKAVKKLKAKTVAAVQPAKHK